MPAFLDICFSVCLLRFSCQLPMASDVQGNFSECILCHEYHLGHVHNTPDLSRSRHVRIDHFQSTNRRDLVSTFPGTDFNGRIGVIAPYRNQIRALQRGMWSTGLRHDGVEVSTVDGFQGR